jgi:Methyltransferase domain
VGGDLLSGASGTAQLELHLAGAFGVVRDGVRLAAGGLRSRKARTLLKLLAVERGRLLSVDRIAEVLWAGDPPAEPAQHVATLAALEYPNSAFTGSDYHHRSIEMARKRAGDAGVADRVNFEVASADGFSGTGYDLAATFDCLHDMGDPLSAARHVRQALAASGTWLIVEPYAAETPFNLIYEARP